eukprot:TRINITY_DN38052_c0_g1_i1.p1 TRINITY_DN38052_c0_g1~~TRINITY_DN38052_c0_g1_i1.p1  ORF type:complete len:338 (+),score=136.08 TRINITY_DN38052_c0_g1_i1:42-1055(+)
MKAVLGCALLAASAAAEPFSFVSIGDWGGAGLGDYHETAELRVAQQFQKTAAAVNSKFIVNVGDNFYYCGVKDVNDTQFQTDFENVFTSTEMQRKWYSSLGNHDYGYNVDAQLQYKSPANNRWYLPARYYSERVELGSGNYMTMIFLDSNPCVNAYRSDNPSGWDPCSGKYGDCPDCKFHDNIIAQDCGAQLTWFEDQMANAPADDWLVIVGHHLAHEMNNADFVAVMQKYGFHMYLNGHQHELNTYTVDGVGNYITTGAGCMVRVPAEFENEPRTIIPESTAHAHAYTWYKKVAGFTSHTFSDDFSSLKTDFIAYNGTVVREVTIDKDARLKMRKL